MASVGGIACDFVHGELAGLRERVSIWQVPGVDGYGVQTLGQGNSRFRFTAVKFGTEAVVTAWFRSIEALAGTVFTVVDDWDRTHANLMADDTGIGTPIRQAMYEPGETHETRGSITIEGVQLA